MSCSMAHYYLDGGDRIPKGLTGLVHAQTLSPCANSETCTGSRFDNTGAKDLLVEMADERHLQRQIVEHGDLGTLM